MQSSCNPACSPHMVPPFLPQCGPSWLWVAALLCRRENRQRSQRCQPHPNLPTGKLGHWDWIFTRPVFDCHWKNKTRTLPLSYIQTHLLWYLKLEEPPKFCNSWWCHTKPPVFTGNFQTLPYRAHWSWWHFFPSMHLAQRPSQSVAHVPIVHYWGSMEAAKSPQPDSAAPGFCWSKFVKFSSLPGSPLLKKNKKNAKFANSRKSSWTDDFVTYIKCFSFPQLIETESDCAGGKASQRAPLACQMKGIRHVSLVPSDDAVKEKQLHGEWTEEPGRKPVVHTSLSDTS